MYAYRSAHAHRRHPSERAFLLKGPFSTHFSWPQLNRSIVRDSSLIARSSRSREKSAIYKVRAIVTITTSMTKMQGLAPKTIKYLMFAFNLLFVVSIKCMQPDDQVRRRVPSGTMRWHASIAAASYRTVFIDNINVCILARSLKIDNNHIRAL